MGAVIKDIANSVKSEPNPWRKLFCDALRFFVFAWCVAIIMFPFFHVVTEKDLFSHDWFWDYRAMSFPTAISLVALALSGIVTSTKKK